MYRELYALAERNALLGLVYYVALNAYYLIKIYGTHCSQEICIT